MARWNKKKRKKRKERKERGDRGEPAPTVTHSAAEARAPRQRKRRDPKSSKRIGRIVGTQERHRQGAINFLKGNNWSNLQRIVDFERSKIKMPRKNEGRRREGGPGQCKSGEFKTRKEAGHTSSPRM